MNVATGGRRGAAGDPDTRWPRRDGPAARRRAGRSPPAGHAGVLSLEFALTVPLVFLVVLVVFHAVVYARDALLVQQAAGRGARAAATGAADAEVVAAVQDSVEGRAAEVEITPSSRAPGAVVRVIVRLRSRAGPGGSEVTATAAGEVEPGGGT